MVKRRWRTGMRRAAALIVLLGAALGTRVAAGQNTAAIPSRIDPKAQQVLDRLIQAMGGPAFLKVKRLTTRGRTFSIRNEATAGYAPFESFVEYPDKRRFSYGKNPPVILINNGDQAWELDRYGKTDQLEEQVRRWQVANRYSARESAASAHSRARGFSFNRAGLTLWTTSPPRPWTSWMPKEPSETGFESSARCCRLASPIACRTPRRRMERVRGRLQRIQEHRRSHDPDAHCKVYR